MDALRLEIEDAITLVMDSLEIPESLWNPRIWYCTIVLRSTKGWAAYFRLIIERPRYQLTLSFSSGTYIDLGDSFPSNIRNDLLGGQQFWVLDFDPYP